jgi:hypothetical protein
MQSRTINDYKCEAQINGMKVGFLSRICAKTITKEPFKIDQPSN